MSQTRFEFSLMGIADLLRRNRLLVPPNQRPYAWEDRHVQDLLQDLHAAIQEDDEDYFLGTIVLIRQGKDIPQIADGQQRLATTAVMLARIRDLFRELKRDPRATHVETEYLQKIDPATEDVVPQLQLNVEDNTFFATSILSPAPQPPAALTAGGRPSNKRLYSASVLIEAYLRRILEGFREDNRADHLLKWLSYLTDNASVAVVTVPDEVGAYRIFETLNDRGLRASQADILKNYLFSRSGNRLREAQALWSGMSGTIESIGDEEDDLLVTYLRHFWITEHGPTKERELAAAIKRESTSETKTLNMLSEASAAAVDYVALSQASHPKWSGYRTSVRHNLVTIDTELKVEQIRPLLFAVARRFSPEEAEKAFRLFVSWSVRFLVYGGRGGLLDRHYSERARDVGVGRITKARELREAMRDVVPNDGEFETAFATARVSKPYLARYYLRAIEKTLRDDPEPWYIENEDPTVINLEHVVPLTPSPDWNLEEDAALAAQKLLGNMVLMRATKNRDLGNATFEKKKVAYKDSPYMTTQQVAEYENWTIAEIRHRQARLAKVAVRTWSLSFAD